MADTAGNLSFLPWVRQGAAGGIATADALSASQPGVAQLQIGLSLNGAAAQPVVAKLRGPADVIGVSANQVVRLEPRAGSVDFEPNHFPSIEFDRVDLPWLFTPLGPGQNAKLRPWLCLVTVRVQDGVAIAPATGASLPRLLIAAPADASKELPDPTESWAWAHAQAASGDSTPAAVSSALSGGSQLSLARLLSPRRLAPNTDYLACVVPTFEIGRKAGLGLAIDPAELNGLAPAWTLAPGQSVTLPVYYSWTFRTGAAGDFASLARKLTARSAPAGLGSRQVDIGHPGFALPASVAQPVVVNVGGALQPVGAPETDPPWPSGVETPFQAALAAIVNAPGLSQTANPNAAPLLAPPLYGRWYAAKTTAAPAGAAWFDELNLDPRWRAIAAFGVGVVQANQEALMASAWRQAAELREANQRLRHLQLSVTVGANLHTRHLAALDDVGAVRVASPAFGRIRSAAAPAAPARTMFAHLADSRVSMAASGAAMRRIARQQGPVTRRAVALAIAQATPAALATVGAAVFAGSTEPSAPAPQVAARLSRTVGPVGARPAVASAAAATTPVGPRLGGVIGPVGGPVSTGAGSSSSGSGGATTAPPFSLAGTLGISRNWYGGLNLVLSAAPPAAPVSGIATVSTVQAQVGGPTTFLAFAAVTSTTVAQMLPEPAFAVVPEGQAVPFNPPPPRFPVLQDSPAGAAFRAAAVAHLQRVDPGRGVPPPQAAAPLDLGAIRTIALTALEPRTTIPALAHAVIDVAHGTSAPAGTPAAATVGIDTAMMAPSFPQPMYEPLRDLSQDLLLPGLETVLPDSVIGLKTNRRFVEAYMIGLNTEMGGELLWRGFPTDQRGTYFAQFWDTRGAPNPRPDIDPPASWGTRALGQATGASGAAAEQFVMLMRGALLQRYPNAVIYAVKAVKANGFRSPSPATQDETYPIFSGALQPDLFFFGFPLAAAAVTGSDGSAGYYIVIQEHPTEPRFGLDAGVAVTTPNVSVVAGLPVGAQAQGFQWGRNSAHMAGVTRRLPSRVAIHGSKFAAAVQGAAQ